MGGVKVIREISAPPPQFVYDLVTSLEKNKKNLAWHSSVSTINRNQVGADLFKQGCILLYITTKQAISIICYILGP